MSIKSVAYAAFDETSPLKKYEYEIRDIDEDEVVIEVKYCGVCHSDISAAHSEWRKALYPLVPGHEYTGVVAKIGPAVRTLKVGDHVGVGPRVGACLQCKCCNMNFDQGCNRCIKTYNGRDWKGKDCFGGYGKYTIAKELWAHKLPEGLGMDVAGPLLCAGVTVWNPMKYNGLDKGGFRVAVVGLGGLGHMALQYAKAFGNKVTAITRASGKEALCKRLGADAVLISSDQAAVDAAVRSFDFIIDTVSDKHDVSLLLGLLDFKGTYIQLGIPPGSDKIEISMGVVIMRRLRLQGFLIGSRTDTKEMLDFSAQHQIIPLIELAKPSQVNECFERICKSDVLFRFVLDISAMDE